MAQNKRLPSGTVWGCGSECFHPDPSSTRGLLDMLGGLHFMIQHHESINLSAQYQYQYQWGEYTSEDKMKFSIEWLIT